MIIAFDDLLGLPDHKMRETQAHGGSTASACQRLAFCEIGLPVFPFFRGAWPRLQPLSPRQWGVLGWTPECELQAAQRDSALGGDRKEGMLRIVPGVSHRVCTRSHV